MLMISQLEQRDISMIQLFRNGFQLPEIGIQHSRSPEEQKI